MNVCRLNEIKSEKNKYGIEIGIKKQKVLINEYDPKL